MMQVGIVGILGIVLSCLPVGCTNDRGDVVVLKHYANKTYQEMYEELGPPTDKTGYIVERAPTKGWNHQELFAVYPKNLKNRDIQIVEVTCDAGDHLILACYHMVEGESRCLVAKRVKKVVRF